MLFIGKTSKKAAGRNGLPSFFSRLAYWIRALLFPPYVQDIEELLDRLGKTGYPQETLAAVRIAQNNTI
jgi:hypothetical protein